MADRQRLPQELVAASRKSAAVSGKKNGGALPRRRYDQIEESVNVLRLAFGFA